VADEEGKKFIKKLFAPVIYSLLVLEGSGIIVPSVAWWVTRRLGSFGRLYGTVVGELV
jgi:hypothetical protein